MAVEAERKTTASSLKVYVDTSVILRRPEIFAYRKRGVDLIVPEAVLAEIGRASSSIGASLRRLVDHARQAGYVTVEPARIDGQISPPKQLDLGRRLRGAEVAILAQIHESAYPRKSLATEDIDMGRAAAAAGFSTMSGEELVALLRDAEERETTIQKAAIKHKIVSWFISILVGLLLTQAGYLLSYSGPALQWSFYNIGIVGIFVAILVGLGLFALRSRRPLLYGVIEVVVGIAAASAGLRSVRDLSLTGSVNLAAILTVLGGVYIVVRGLDNVQRGSEGTWLERPLSRLSGSTPRL